MSLEARIAELNENIVKLIGVMSKGQPLAPSADKPQPDKPSAGKPTEKVVEATAETAKPEVAAIDFAALRKTAGESVLAKAKTNRAAVVAVIEKAQEGAKKLGDISDANLQAVIDELDKIK